MNKIDLNTLSAAAELRALTDELRTIAQDRRALEAQASTCQELEEKAAALAADLARLRARRIDLLADELGGADVSEPLAQLDKEIAQAEPVAMQAADRGAAAAQVRARLWERMDGLERRRTVARAAMRDARYRLLRDAAEIAAGRFVQARTAMEASYGALCAALAAGTQEALRHRDADPAATTPVLCSTTEIHRSAKAASWISPPPGSPFFDAEAERQRAAAGDAVSTAWNLTRDELTAQLAELCGEGSE